MMYRITGNSMYREWGWKIFQSFQEYTCVPGGEGYTSLNDVRTVPPTTRDNMESFWLVSLDSKFWETLGSYSVELTLSDAGRNSQVPVFAIFTDGLHAVDSGCLQHRGASISEVHPEGITEDRLGKTAAVKKIFESDSSTLQFGTGIYLSITLHERSLVHISVWNKD